MRHSILKCLAILFVGSSLAACIPALNPFDLDDSDDIPEYEAAEKILSYNAQINLRNTLLNSSQLLLDVAYRFYRGLDKGVIVHDEGVNVC